MKIFLQLTLKIENKNRKSSATHEKVYMAKAQKYLEKYFLFARSSFVTLKS